MRAKGLGESGNNNSSGRVQACGKEYLVWLLLHRRVKETPGVGCMHVMRPVVTTHGFADALHFGPSVCMR